MPASTRVGGVPSQLAIISASVRRARSFPGRVKKLEKQLIGFGCEITKPQSLGIVVESSGQDRGRVYAN
jgi:hypothetical protein